MQEAAAHAVPAGQLPADPVDQLAHQAHRLVELDVTELRDEGEGGF